MSIEEFLSVPAAEWVARLRAAGYVSPVELIQEHVRELEAGLRRHGRHTNTAALRCGFFGDGAEVDCTCGLIDLLDGNPPGTMARELGGGKSISG